MSDNQPLHFMITAPDATSDQAPPKESLSVFEDFVWDSYVLASRESEPLPILPDGVDPADAADLFYAALTTVYCHIWCRYPHLPPLLRELLAEEVSQDVIVSEWGSLLERWSPGHRGRCLQGELLAHLTSVSDSHVERRVKNDDTFPPPSLDPSHPLCLNSLPSPWKHSTSDHPPPKRKAHHGGRPSE